ncbi:hypothetical protein F4813DRAFT_386581 [Daldinia decipiens]|uniref:uncharacterized protein n=1 Tax=Daldinia decipiens TaxID=326647 RepID=UPI0020C21904|nr:uncharacterized protein F4813DRAFT_386581 [Daldinia decipiens]KAI1660382.1 hypothetical protein F4813DRAFT_386581 [Daldinia decipiens]
MAPYTMFHSLNNNTSVIPRWLTSEEGIIATTLVGMFDNGSVRLSRRDDPYHRNLVTYIIVGAVVFLFLLAIPALEVCRRKSRWGKTQRDIPSSASAEVNDRPVTPPTQPTPESWEQELRDWREMHWAAQEGASDHFIVPPSSTYPSKRRVPVHYDGENDDQLFVVGSMDYDEHHEGLRSPVVIGISTATAMPIKNVSGSQKSIDLGSAKSKESEDSATSSLQDGSDKGASGYWDSIVDDIVKQD